MGKAYVGLFDENGLSVIVMYWGDIWPTTQKGYFYTFFYEQGGTSYNQYSGYITTTFTRTGKMWWDPWMGGDGAIYSTIDGAGDSYPIAECDNCSRVIKYVVTYGARLDSSALIQMRVHDVSVLTDLDAVNPTSPDPDEPVVSDGTPTGVNPSGEATSFVDMLVGMACANTISWWTGWWPVLHVKTLGTLESGATYSYQVGVDILGSGTFEGMSIETPEDDDLSDAQVEAMAQGGIVDFLLHGLRAEMALAFSASVIMFTIDVLLSKLMGLPTPAQLVLLAILLASYSVVMLLALGALWDGILTHRLDSSVVWYTLAFLAGMLIMQGYWNWGKMGAIWATWWYQRHLLNVGPRAVAFCLLSFLILAVKAFFIGAILGMMVRCWELWCMGW